MKNIYNYIIVYKFDYNIMKNSRSKNSRSKNTRKNTRKYTKCIKKCIKKTIRNQKIKKGGDRNNSKIEIVVYPSIFDEKQLKTKLNIIENPDIKTMFTDTEEYLQILKDSSKIPKKYYKKLLEIKKTTAKKMYEETDTIHNDN